MRRRSRARGRVRRFRARDRNLAWLTSAGGNLFDDQGTLSEVIADTNLILGNLGDAARNLTVTCLRLVGSITFSHSAATTAGGYSLQARASNWRGYIAKFHQDETFEDPDDSSEEDTVWTGQHMVQAMSDDDLTGGLTSCLYPVGFGRGFEIDVPVRRKFSFDDNLSLILEGTPIVGTTGWHRDIAVATYFRSLWLIP